MTDPTCSDLDHLGLSVRTYNALRRAKVHTIADVLRLGRAHFETPGRRVGPASRMEIAERLEASGFHWTAEGAPPLPELPTAAAEMVKALGLGDSAEIRRGLARVLRAAVELPDVLGIRFTATDLEHGAR
jgi:hypothetical protein